MNNLKNKQFKYDPYTLFSWCMIFLSIGFFFVNVNYLFDSSSDEEQDVIGFIKTQSNSVRIKKDDSLSWVDTSQGSFLYQKSLMFTGNRSSAEYVLLDGTIIRQEPETLIVLNYNGESIKKPTKNDSFQVEVLRGGLEMESSGDVSTSVSMGDRKLQLRNEESHFSLKSDTAGENIKIDMKKGNAKFEMAGKDAVEIKEGEVLDLNEENGAEPEVSQSEDAKSEESSLLDSQGSSDFKSTFKRPGFKEFINSLLEIFIPKS